MRTSGIGVKGKRKFALVRHIAAGAVAAALLVIGWLYLPHVPSRAAETPVRLAVTTMPARSPKPGAPVVIALPPVLPSAAEVLDERINQLGTRFEGEVGIAVRDVQTGWTSDHQGLHFFPQQSVSKLWIALSALDQADRGELDMAAPVTVRRSDLTLFHQPIRRLALRPGGFRTTFDDLLARTLTESDNSANDRLLRQVGGPDKVRATLAAKAISGIRFGPGERLLQSHIAGLDWKPAYAVGKRFFVARAAVPDETRHDAFEAYVADPVDGATPLAVADTLARLKQGKLLSEAATEHMLTLMSQTKTGPRRLKGGLEAGWSLSHKTGTGQIFDGEQAGYNDVGILTSPNGRSYAIAVLIGRTSRPLKERMALMQDVVEATIEYDAILSAQQAAMAKAAEHS